MIPGILRKTSALLAGFALLAAPALSQNTTPAPAETRRLHVELTLEEAIAPPGAAPRRLAGQIHLPLVLLVLPLVQGQPPAVAQPVGRGAELRPFAAPAAGLRHGRNALSGELQPAKHDRPLDPPEHRPHGRHAATLLVGSTGWTSSPPKIRNPTTRSPLRSPTPSRSSPTTSSSGTRRSHPRSTSWPNAPTSRRWRT